MAYSTRQLVGETPPIAHQSSPGTGGGPTGELRFVTSHNCHTQVVAIRDVHEIASYLPAIEELASAAGEPNVFYEPWMLLPALDSFGRAADLLFVLVYSIPDTIPGGPRAGGAEHKASYKASYKASHEASSTAASYTATEPQQLLGFFPLQRSTRYRRLPFSVLRLWRHDQCALCTPLVRRGFAREAVASFLDWARSPESRCHFIEFGLISGEGDFAAALKQHLSERSIRYFKADWFSRALFRPAADAESYLRQAKGKRHRKDIARREGRLAAAGRMEYAHITDQAEVDGWAQYFLELEAGGWKGRSQSALACVSGGRAFLTSIVKEAFARNRLMILGIKLDGIPIAAKLSFIAGTGSFAFKIAFDEAYSEFSRGLLLEVENIRCLHEMPAIEWMDSCAAPRHPMIDHLWPGRKTIETILIPGARKSGSLILATFPFVRSIKQSMRRFAEIIRSSVRRTSLNRSNV